MVPTVATGGREIAAPDLALLCSRSAQRLGALVDEALAPFSVRGRHYRVMVAVRDFSAASQQAIGDRLGIDRTTMASIVDVLEERQLAVRAANPANRRAHHVKLTPDGRRQLLRMERAVAGVEDTFLHPLSSEQADTLRELLAQVSSS